MIAIYILGTLVLFVIGSLCYSLIGLWLDQRDENIDWEVHGYVPRKEASNEAEVVDFTTEVLDATEEAVEGPRTWSEVMDEGRTDGRNHLSSNS